MPDPIRPFAATARFQAALRAFEDANRADPHREQDPADGLEHPREALHARRLSDWIDRLRPDASEALCLAARCQHIRRWEIPRSEYPADRAGYLRWKRDLQQFHARCAGEILAGCGYDETTIARVRSLNLKQNLSGDPECQALEDALCLVFLEHQLADLSQRTPENKLITALRKSWAKMSENGRTAALALPLGPRERRLVELALESIA